MDTPATNIGTDAAPQLLQLPTIRANRKVINLQEWIASQVPWRRSLYKKVQARIQDAA